MIRIFRCYYFFEYIFIKVYVCNFRIDDEEKLFFVGSFKSRNVTSELIFCEIFP